MNARFNIFPSTDISYDIRFNHTMARDNFPELYSKLTLPQILKFENNSDAQGPYKLSWYFNIMAKLHFVA